MAKEEKKGNIDTWDLVEKLFESDKVILLDFWANWCEPCKALNPVIKSIAKEYKDVFHVFQIDIEKNPQMKEEFSIMSIPTLIVFKDGDEVNRMIGITSKEEIIDNIKPYLE